MNQRVAHRYAQALLDLAKDRDVVAKVLDDQKELAVSWHEVKEFRAALNNPIIRPNVKVDLLHKLFESKLTPETMRFLDLLIRKGRGGMLGLVAEEFIRMIETERNILHAEITSAIELSSSEKKELQAKLENMSGKSLIVKFVIDLEVRGGFIARMGDTFIDASLRHQLEVLREQFKKGGAPILN